MVRLVTLACFALAFAYPAWAASDEELEKCVAGSEVDGGQFHYRAGGTYDGVVHYLENRFVVGGAWEIKNGVMTLHSESYTRSFPIRMDDAGNCFLETPTGERPIQK